MEAVRIQEKTALLMLVETAYLERQVNTGLSHARELTAAMLLTRYAYNSRYQDKSRDL